MGEIEVGGIDAEKVFRNPPLHLLEKEIAKHADFIIFHALISPLIAFRDLIVEKTGEDTFKIRAVVAFGTALGPAAWIVARNISTKTEGREVASSQKIWRTLSLLATDYFILPSPSSRKPRAGRAWIQPHQHQEDGERGKGQRGPTPALPVQQEHGAAEADGKIHWQRNH